MIPFLAIGPHIFLLPLFFETMLVALKSSFLNKKFDQLKVAIVADWLTNYGGAESVVESFTRVFPHADLFTTVYVPEQMKNLGEKQVHTSFLQKFPRFLRKRHQVFFPFLHKAIETLDLSKYDLVISSSSFVGKGCLTNPETLHICYCHTPTRYLWDNWQEYVREFPLPFGTNWLKKAVLPSLLSRLRIWDRFAADRPDVYIANSVCIAERISRYYHHSSTVITPPVSYETFAAGMRMEKKDFYVAMGRLTPYKRFDLLIDTFKIMPEKKLKIVGKGPDMIRLQGLAADAPNIEFLGFLPDTQLPEILGQAEAFLFPQIEDAGIAPLEAMAAGTPVIALQQGGALDVVREGVNGIFFPEQSVQSLRGALHAFEDASFDRAKVQQSVQQFSHQEFEQKIKEFCEEEWERFAGK